MQILAAAQRTVTNRVQFSIDRFLAARRKKMQEQRKHVGHGKSPRVASEREKDIPTIELEVGLHVDAQQREQHSLCRRPSDHSLEASDFHHKTHEKQENSNSNSPIASAHAPMWPVQRETPKRRFPHSMKRRVHDFLPRESQTGSTPSHAVRTHIRMP